MIEHPLREPVTHLLSAVGRGEDGARDDLLQAVYQELRALAGQQLAAERKGHTLQPTALVHEAFVRLLGNGPVDFASRRHFFAAAARAMRRIRVDHARKRGSLKRGGDRRRGPLADGPAVAERNSAELLAVNEAMENLEHRCPRQADVVHHRYFLGLTVEETATAMGLSPRTVNNLWRLARAWLHRELSKGDTGV